MIEIAHAAAGAAHHGEGIPTDVYWQIANLILVYVAFYFIFKKVLKPMFAQRKDQFVQMMSKAESAKVAAETAVKEMNTKLISAEEKAKNIEKDVQQQLLDIKTQLLADADKQLEKMKKDSELLIEQKLNQAKREIAFEIVNKSMEGAEAKLQKGLSEVEKTKIQRETSGRLQVVMSQHEN